MAEHAHCEADDCPCWLAGRESMRVDYRERESDLLSAVAELLQVVEAEG